MWLADLSICHEHYAVEMPHMWPTLHGVWQKSNNCYYWQMLLSASDVHNNDAERWNVFFFKIFLHFLQNLKAPFLLVADNVCGVDRYCMVGIVWSWRSIKVDTIYTVMDEGGGTENPMCWESIHNLYTSLYLLSIHSKCIEFIDICV